MREIIVFLFLDALPYERIFTRMPSLSNFCTKGTFRVLSNVLGYSFAIHSTMLSGTYPDENNLWLPYYFSPETSPFKFLDHVPNLLTNFLDKGWLPRYGIRELSRLIQVDGGKKTIARNIPFSILSYFDFYPNWYMNESPFFQELRRHLSKRDTKLLYLGPPKQKSNLYRTFLNCLKEEFRDKEKNSNTIFLLYDDKLDDYSHTYGPDSEEASAYLVYLDRTLDEIFKILKIKLDEDGSRVIVFSDHGHATIRQTVDILNYLSKQGLRLGKDFLCFIDATLALFWVEDGKMLEKLMASLNRLKVGKIINEDLRRKYRIDFHHRLYGDIFYVLPPGYMFFPNFWGRIRPMKGAHGYEPEFPCQKAFFATNLKYSTIPGHVKDIRSVIAGLSM